MSKKPLVLLKDKIYFPYKSVDRKALKKHMRIEHFDNKTCNTAGPGGTKCPHKDDRPTDACTNCPGFYGVFKFYNEVKIDNKDYIGISKGRMDLVEDITGNLKNFKVVDARTVAPMKSKLKFTGTPYDYQEEAVNEMLKHEHGVLCSAPRTGKTIMSVMVTCRLKQKTLIIAHQDDLLKQFYKTFQTFTNCDSLTTKKGKPVVVIANKRKDFFSGADVVLVTYQKFIREVGKKLLNKLAKKYGLIITDEVHKGNADAYSLVLSSLYPKYMYGVTATPRRKDCKEFIVNRIVGDIIHKTTAKSLTPTVIVKRSAMKAKVSARMWHAILKALYNNKPRTKHIVAEAMKDLEKGHNILIPIQGNRAACEMYAQEINIAWMNKKKTTKQIAEPFYRYANKNMKEDVLNRARSGKTRVIVAMRSMLTGVDVPRWSMIYEISPINNEPNFEQEALRVCTPFENKPKPVIKFFVDVHVKASTNCFISTIRHCNNLNFNIPDKTKKRISKIMQESRSGPISIDSDTQGLHPRLLGNIKI